MRHIVYRVNNSANRYSAALRGTFWECITHQVWLRRQRGTAKQRAKWKTRRCSRSGHSVPCRYSSPGRHVTLNIGRKPKLITTTSILLGMPPPLPAPFRVTEDSGTSHTTSLSLTSMWSTYRSSDEANRFLPYLLRFVSPTSPPLSPGVSTGNSVSERPHQGGSG